MTNFEKQFKEVDLELHGVRLPKFQLTQELRDQRKIPNNIEGLELLKFLVKRGFDNRYELGDIPKDRVKEYIQRLDYELSVVGPTDFVEYLLIIWDIAEISLTLDVPCGPGRGSAASSLILYCLNITHVDPIKNGLFFERFLAPSRTKANVVNGINYYDGGVIPDVDQDISYSHRELLIKELQQKYKDRFVKLATHATLQGKKCIKDVTKVVLGYSEEKAREISDLIPTLYGKVYELKKAYKEVMAFKNWADANPVAYKVALKLSGLIVGQGSHASAYLITYEDFKNTVPCQLSTDGELLTCYDMTSACIENIKVDLLGLKAVTIIDEVCKMTKVSLREVDKDISYETVFSHLQDVKCPYGLFQISGDCNLKIVNKVKPKNINEMSAVVALARPGALEYVDRYASFTNDNISDSLHSFFEKSLKDTGFLPLFQEQMMTMLNQIGFTLEEADKARKVVGKKLVKEVGEWKDKIYNKVKENNLDQSIADVTWSLLESSANYLFAKAHSVPYAQIGIYTTYLKWKYPREFFLACLRIAQTKADFSEEFGEIQREIPHFRIQLLPPDIIKSELGFSLAEGGIRFGISNIKGISDKAIEKLKSFIGTEKVNKFAIFEAAKEVKLNIGVLSALIQSGALTDCGENRVKSVLEAQVWYLLTPRERVYCLKNGHKFNFELIDMLQEETFLNWVDDNGKKLTKLSRLNTIRKNSANYFSIYRQNSNYYGLANYWYEKQLLGFSHSSSLKDVFSYEHEGLRNSKELVDFVPIDGFVQIVGEVKEVKEGMSKAGNKYVKLVLTDELGQFSAMMVGQSFGKYLKNGKLMPQEGDLILIKGKKSEDIIWINDMDIQNHKIYMKLADLKNFQAKEEKQPK